MTQIEPQKVDYSNGGSDHERLVRIEHRMRWIVWLAVGLAVIAVTLSWMIVYMMLPRSVWW